MISWVENLLFLFNTADDCPLKATLWHYKYIVISTVCASTLANREEKVRQCVYVTDLGLQLQHPLPGLSQLSLGLSLSQPHTHQLVLQLTQRVPLRAVLPATCRASQVALWRGLMVGPFSITLKPFIV